MRDHCEGIRDLALIDLLASTGMRVGELVKLNRNDIDFETGNASLPVKAISNVELFRCSRKDTFTTLFGRTDR